MLEWITFGLIVAKIVLDFVAPKTKTKVDDKARDAVGKAQELLPMASMVVKATTDSKATRGFTPQDSRDHRK